MKMRLAFLYVILMALVSLSVVSCSSEPPPSQLRSLAGSSAATFVCLENDASGVPKIGKPLTECPTGGAPTDVPRTMMAIVNQPGTGQIAMLSLTSCEDGSLGIDRGGQCIPYYRDHEPIFPAITFLTVGERPTELATTPGGTAVYVGVGEPGAERVTVVPSSCLAPRQIGEPLRDVTSWASCRLPSAPSRMSVVVDPALDADGNPTTNPDNATQIRTSCSSSYIPIADLPVAPAATRPNCPLDMDAEAGPAGRRKLYITLPEEGEIWVLDAQSVADRALGSAENCIPEVKIALSTEVPAGVAYQPLPFDYPTDDATCRPREVAPLPVGSFKSNPSDWSWANGVAYVADLGVPLIHRIDVSEPCKPVEIPPLLPIPYTEPGAPIFSRSVSVSELTSKNQRFVYAVEKSQVTTDGTVMVFDVSSNSESVTPIMRPRSAYNPQEPPDRIKFSAPALSATLAFTDFPVVADNTAVGREGYVCNANPTALPTDPGTRYRPASDLSTGAAPAELRGTFAYIALADGSIRVVDVDDLDAPCRRPITSEENFRGCEYDTTNTTYVTANGDPTVTNELSCQVVQPHRSRSGSFFVNNSDNARSAALQAFPRLLSSTGSSLSSDQSDAGKKNPKLIGVDYTTDSDPSVWIGSREYIAAADASDYLDLDPRSADKLSLLISYEEPRAFSVSELFNATFEGVISTGAEAIFTLDADQKSASIRSSLNANFCRTGVQDEAATREFGRKVAGVQSSLPGEEPNGLNTILDSFAVTHSDYVQLTGDFPESTSAYWETEGIARCSKLFTIVDDYVSTRGRDNCTLYFGGVDTPLDTRDYKIVEAYQERMQVVPRNETGAKAVANLAWAQCCFPELVDMKIRGGNQWIIQGSTSGFTSNMTANPVTTRCEAGCEPSQEGRSGRVLEISCGENCEANSVTGNKIGPAEPDDVCVVSSPSDLEVGGAAENCAFRGLGMSFAIYRGSDPSRRDILFNWQISGGFNPMSVRPASSSTYTIPTRIYFIPEINRLGVTDAGTYSFFLLGLRYLDFATATFTSAGY